MCLADPYGVIYTTHDYFSDSYNNFLGPSSTHPGVYVCLSSLYKASQTSIEIYQACITNYEAFTAAYNYFTVPSEAFKGLLSDLV